MLTSGWIWITTYLRPPAGDNGQDVVEYALLCGLITLATLVLLVLVGPYIKNAFQDTINAINSGP